MPPTTIVRTHRVRPTTCPRLAQRYAEDRLVVSRRIHDLESTIRVPEASYSPVVSDGRARHDPSRLATSTVDVEP